jgi:hypothetical protein
VQAEAETVTQTLPAPTTIDWWPDAAIYRNDPPDVENAAPEVDEKDSRRSIAGRLAALLGHTGRAVLHALIDGLAQHGAAHHGFPDYHWDDEDADEA